MNYLRNYPSLASIYTTHQPFFLKQPPIYDNRVFVLMWESLACIFPGLFLFRFHFRFRAGEFRRGCYRGFSLLIVHDSPLVAWMLVHSFLYLCGRPLSVVLPWGMSQEQLREESTRPYPTPTPLEQNYAKTRLNLANLSLIYSTVVLRPPHVKRVVIVYLSILHESRHDPLFTVTKYIASLNCACA